MSSVEYPEVTSYPVNGFGGTLFDYPFFAVPIYNPAASYVNHHVTWHVIDNYTLSAVNIAVTDSVCLGLCFATLIYVLALTPKKKRRTPFHAFLLAALVLEIIRLLCYIGPASSVGNSLFSSYLGITHDWSATVWST